MCVDTDHDGTKTHTGSTIIGGHVLYCQRAASLANSTFQCRITINFSTYLAAHCITD